MGTMDNNKQIRNEFTSFEDTFSNVETIMQLCQAFVIIGVVLSALLTFVLSLCFFILVSSIIAFLGFLGITAAFESDNGSTCNYGPCRKFMSPSSRTNAGANLDEVQEWGARE